MARFNIMHQPLIGYRSVLSWASLFLTVFVFSQNPSPNIRAISIQRDSSFDGFELLELNEEKVFVLAEHWHNIRSVPRATMKMLKYLHQKANVRILAIEQGHSSAYLVNKYLSSGDTLILRKIARNTMFWGKENYAFFQDLYEFNQTLREADRVIVKSVDIEYKMESAILVINDFIGNKEIPQTLNRTVGTFQQLFEENREHRESFDALAVMYYYDLELVTQLVNYTLRDLEDRRPVYKDFFGTDFTQFSTMIRDMVDGLLFDYINPNTNYKFRDQLIHEKFLQLLEAYPNKGILCPIGMRHATRSSSIFKLNTQDDSPVRGRVMNIRVSALFKKTFKTSDLRRINFSFPKQLRANGATLIRHDPGDPTLRSAKSFHYTLFLNDNDNLTPFANRLEEGY